MTSTGIALGYAEAGGGDATPIVFLHGVGSDKSVWRRQLDHFKAERCAIAFCPSAIIASKAASNCARL